jgi:integrase
MDRKGRKPRRQFGTLRQLPSGRWQASYIGPDGQRHYAPTSFRTERDGATWLTRVEADLSSGKWRDESLGRQLFRDYAEAYLDENPGVGERWAETCRRNMRLHMADLLDKPLVGITPAVVRNWYGKAMKGNGGKRSIGQAYSFGRAVMNAALRDDAIDRNPFNIPGASADTAKERLIATPAEVAALMEAITPRYRAAIALAAWCSLRRGEVCALRTADIDFETKHVHIRKNWVELLESPKMVEKDPKTDAGKRAISVPPHVWPTVVEHSEKWAGPVFFFVGRDGQRMRGNAVYQAFVRARSKVGVDATFHDLRHTGLSLAAASGANLADLKKRAGHASSTAAQRYMHAVEGRDEAIGKALSDIARSGDAARLPRTIHVKS